MNKFIKISLAGSIKVHLFLSLCHFYFKLVVIVVFIFGLYGCNSFERVQDSAIARVGDTYLYSSDLNRHFESFSNSNDSLVQVQNYINTWAKEQLIYQQADLNIESIKKKELQSLVRQYEVELYGQVYKEFILNTRMDTLITDLQIKQAYESNKPIFKLSESIYQFRLLRLPMDNVDRKEISWRLRRFDINDRKFLDSLSFQFSYYHPWDSIWVSQNEIIQKINFVTEKNIERYFKNKNYYEVSDSLDVYLFVTKNRMKANETAPLAHVKKTLKNLILNRRKIEFSRNFDNEILQDAIRSKKYELLID